VSTTGADRLRAETEAAGEETRRLDREEPEQIAYQLADFLFDKSQDKFRYEKTGAMMSAMGVNASVPSANRVWNEETEKLIPPSVWLTTPENGRVVDTSTWDPTPEVKGERIIRGYSYATTARIPDPRAVVYNEYRAAEAVPAPPEGVNAAPYLAHVAKLYPDKQEQAWFLDYCSFMLQHPGVKINHGILLAGPQGIGKDSLFYPLIRAVGPGNHKGISAAAIGSRFNGYMQCLLLVISELAAKDTDRKASEFYTAMKPVLASDNDMVSVEEKHMNTRWIPNVCCTLMTTNELTSLYIAEDDRRFYIMDSPITDPEAEGLDRHYFARLFEGYYKRGGWEAAVGYLRARDISAFDPKGRVSQTFGSARAKQAMEESRRTPVDGFLDDYFRVRYEDEERARPEVVFGKDLWDWLEDRMNHPEEEEIRRLLQHKSFHYKMDTRGFDLHRNGTSQWCGGKRGSPQEFRSRAAFVSKTVPRAAREELIREEIQARVAENIAKKTKGPKLV
jgi:hypothetical protein